MNPSSWWFAAFVVIGFFLSMASGGIVPPLIFLGTLTLIATGIRKVPTIHYGIVTFLGNRTPWFREHPRIVKEGWALVIPFFEQIELFRIELETSNVGGFTVTTFDKLDLTITGSVQWWPGQHPKGRLGDALRRALNIFLQMDPKTINGGLVDAVKERISEIAGRTLGEDFYRNREAISFLINCLLRLDEEEEQPEIPTKWVLEGKEAPEGTPGAERVYDLAALMREKDAIKPFREAMKEEEGRSETELRYGIDIQAFLLADVDFTQEMKRALEAQQEKARQMDGADAIMRWKQEKAGGLVEELGLDPKDAADIADVTVEQALAEKGREPTVKKQVISLGGEAGNILGHVLKKITK